ncbi:MAG: transglycosylase SLT domain-containing protein [Buchnera aphidicola (Meitanaphis elongallis)]
MTYIVFFIMLFSGFNNSGTKNRNNYKARIYNHFCSTKFIHSWSKIIKQSSKKYKVDERLIKSIICIESSGNTKAISRSNAIGLMQIKPFSAGREVYRFQGKIGQPSLRDLYNPKINIDIGTAYVHILQHRELVGIHNMEMLRYATIISYVNGSQALFRTFSSSREEAIKKLNKMKKQEFFSHIKKNIEHYKLGNILKK